MAGQILRREGVDIPHRKAVRAPVLRIGAPLHRVDVIGEQGAPPRTQARAGHAATGEELVHTGRAIVGHDRWPQGLGA